MTDKKKIPTVLFYGDTHQPGTPEALYCEALSVRSRKHQFKIGPHRHHAMSQIFYLNKGGGIVYLDGQPTKVKAPCLIVIAEMCVHHFDWSADVEGQVLTISTPLLENLEQQFNTDKSKLRSTFTMPVKQNREEFDHIIKLLLTEYRKMTDDARGHALLALINLFHVWLERNAPTNITINQTQDRATEYINRYTQMVNRDYAEQRKIESYADELGITAPHLNSLCKKILNKNAQQVVHERLLLEAKRFLIYTVLSISQIGYQLGFSDPAYFTRFFKKMTGTSPKEFRVENNNPK